jgi:hypothetical protein
MMRGARFSLSSSCSVLSPSPLTPGLNPSCAVINVCKLKNIYYKKRKKCIVIYATL